MAPPGNKGKSNAAADDAPVQNQPNAPAEDTAILQEIPTPITTLDLSDPESLPERYKQCVDDIIDAMRKWGTVFTFKDRDDDEVEKCTVPVTPGPDYSPAGAYSIELTNGKRKLLLVAEKHQNWFRGIVTESGGRYEINGKTPKMMVGSGSLHTTSMYYDLLKQTVDRCKIGFNPLIDAFYALVGHDDDNKKNYHNAIAVILVMLFEAPRFLELCERNVKLLKEKREEEVGKADKDKINDWSVICRKFFSANGDKMTVTLSDNISAAVTDVATGVRILCGSKWDEWLKKNKKETAKKFKWKSGAGSSGT